VLEKLDIQEIEIDIKLGQSKWRYTVMGNMREEKEKRQNRKQRRNETGIGDTPQTPKTDTNQEEEERKRKKASEMEEEETRQLFDPINKIFDGRKLRVTDLPFNPRVTLPRGIPEEEEASLETRGRKHLEIVRKYIAENCNEHGEQVQNLSKGAQKGIKSLKKRIKEGDLVVLELDKSNRFCVTDINTYRRMGEVQTKKDKKITRENMIKNEKTLNSHAAMMRKMFNFGTNHDQGDRVHTAVTSTDQNTATLSLGEKTRPLVSGNTSNTQGLSTMGSVLFEAVAQCVEDPYKVNSTEDMGSVCIGVNKLIREKIDKEIEDEENGVFGNSVDNANETRNYSPKSCNISRNENLGSVEQGEM
jgi:hypothetical protein